MAKYCPECGEKLKPTDILITVTDSEGHIIGYFHLPKTVYDAVLKKCQENGVTFENWFFDQVHKFGSQNFPT